MSEIEKPATVLLRVSESDNDQSWDRPLESSPSPRMKFRSEDEAMLPKQLRQPFSLEMLATYRIVEWIKSHIKTIPMDEATKKSFIRHIPFHDVDNFHKLHESKEFENKMSQDIEAVRKYFKNVPSFLINNLLADFIVDISQDMRNYDCLVCRKYPTTRWIEVFFTNNATNLCFDFLTLGIFLSSLTTKSNLLINLTTLTLYLNSITFDSVSKTEELCLKYAEFFKNLPNMKYLTVTCGSDKLLHCIADNCKTLVQIDIYYRSGISIETLDYVTQISNIKTVRLFDFKQDQKRGNWNKKPSVLNFISTNRKLQITSYIISNESTAEVLQVLNEHPMIQSLNFRKTRERQTLHHYLESLNSLQNLRELEMYNHDFYADGVKEVLDKVGRNIEKLKLSYVGQLDFQTFKCISEMCPNLKNLTVTTSKFLVNDAVACGTNYFHLTRNTEDSLLKKLQKLVLQICHRRELSQYSIQPSSEHILSLFLLENSPNIEYVDLNNVMLTKDFLLEVLVKNPLKCLKYLCMPLKLDQLVIDRIKEKGLTPEVCYNNTLVNNRVFY